ncbi:MAG: helix-turn-helix transcriptional regulator [Clostridia bacterium]|nr:helix-turn-helix transcriptional regulator [Clostridia bacterium]
MSDFQKHLAEQMKDPEFAAEYEALGPQYSFARQIIAARIAAGMTQAELAEKAGTSQANICKLEHADLNPSFALAERVAQGLGKHLTLSLQ